MNRKERCFVYRCLVSNRFDRISLGRGLLSLFTLCFAVTLSAIAQPIELNSPNPNSGGNFGFVSVLPDARGPGLGNVVVGAPGDEEVSSPSESGRAYIFDGSTGAFLDTLSSPNEEDSGLFGFLVSSVPDVNGDGFWEIVVGARQEDPGASPDNAGRAYIFDGSTSQLLRTLASPNEDTNGLFGFKLSGISDINGNGSGDVIVGARNENPGSSPSNAGRAYVFDGSSGVVIHTLVSPNETINGDFGSAVANVPDVNGDSVEDIVVGAEGEAFLAGRAYLFNGVTGSFLKTLNSPTPVTGGQFGWSVRGVPDTNGDGRGEVIVGAPQEDPPPSFLNAGRAHIFDGSSGSLLYSLRSPYEGIATLADEFGFFVSGSVDLNSDGRGEVMVGESDGGPDAAGQVYIFDGANGDLLYTLRSPNVEPDGSGGRFNYPAQGDFNGDSEPDLVIGAWTETSSGFNGAGRTYIFHGPFPSAEAVPNIIDFGSQDYTSGPMLSMTVTLTNLGTDPLSITEVDLIGFFADQFSITGDTGETSIGVGMSRSVDVAFGPSSLGEKEAKIRFVSESFVWQTDLKGAGIEAASSVDNWNLY